MAAAAAGGGAAERWQMRLHRQMHKHAVMRTNETTKAAPAMLKAQPDMYAHAPMVEALCALVNWVRYWRSVRSG